MKVAVAYADNVNQIWLRIDVPEDTTVVDAIQLSGILRDIPSIDLEEHKIGIFGKVVKPSTVLSEGDRVEIYRPITADPETVPRRDEDD